MSKISYIKKVTLAAAVAAILAPASTSCAANAILSGDSISSIGASSELLSIAPNTISGKMSYGHSSHSSHSSHVSHSSHSSHASGYGY